ncbi:MAG: adenosylcobinamide-GDP ribazoletransferase [Sulfolobales archaeon]
MSILRGFLSLISLLTRIPIKNSYSDLEEAARVFFMVPFIGVLEGFIASSALILMVSAGLNPLLISIILIALHVLVTGGIHLDGFADYSDVIGSLRRGEEALKIIKDPRRGTFSILSLIIGLMINYSSLQIMVSSIEIVQTAIYIMLSYVAASEAMFIACYFGREEPYNGMARYFTFYSKIFRNAILNIIIYVFLSILLIFLQGLRTSLIMILILPLIAGFIIAMDAERRLGFINGDVLGFSYEFVRISSLLILSLTLRPL